MLAVTPLYGDPDLYIGVYPNIHPSSLNRTWYSAAYGADTLTIQSVELQQYCIPNSSIAFACQVYITVQGFMNSSYTLMAKINDGFTSASYLIEGKPQSDYVEERQYVYYKYLVPAFDPNGGSVPGSLTFSLTPNSGEGDQDLYISFSGEPGIDNHDYQSLNRGEDDLIIDATMPHYCLGCTIYLAVYGYSAGHYTISATSLGVTTLQIDRAINGNVGLGKMRYYMFQNIDPVAVITMSLTSTMGDSDLFINTYHKSESSQIPFPTILWNGYQWSSRSSFGSDVVTIRYDDSKFCYDCYYIIGIYGYKNSSYNLIVSSSEESIIHLPHDQAIKLSLKAMQVRYCSYLITGSSEKLLLSLTTLDVGSADLFVSPWDTSLLSGINQSDILPDPMIPSSYQYTTAGSEDDIVNLVGPFENETLIFICVRANTDVQFNILVSSSHSTITLFPGSSIYIALYFISIL